eukprot:4143245-Amphidinium_carterae.1
MKQNRDESYPLKARCQGCDGPVWQPEACRTRGQTASQGGGEWLAHDSNAKENLMHKSINSSLMVYAVGVM